LIDHPARGRDIQAGLENKNPGFGRNRMGFSAISMSALGIQKAKSRSLSLSLIYRHKKEEEAHETP
jgi:hypothetical protein